MRTDTAVFSEENAKLAKRPRYVVELAFDSDNTILWYFTSHSDAALPGGGSVIHDVLEGLSSTSQTLKPDVANSSIGNVNFRLVDKASAVTSALGGQLVLGRSTRRQRVRVYVGFEGMEWADYTLVQTQLVTQITHKDGQYQFSCADVQRELRKDIFELAKTTLAASVAADATVIDVASTAAFSMVAHGTSYSDAPSATVGYLKIRDEVIRYTGKTSTQFTGCTKGALNTRRQDHAVDLAASADRRTAVEEYVYLEMPALKLMYALLTGVLYGQGGAVLPAAWHLGVPTDYVRLSDFIDDSKSDLWNPADDVAGFHVRFEGLKKTDGKKFIETELALLAGVFMPVYADGALGLKRMANVLAGAAYVKLLEETNLASAGELVHDFDSLRNVISIGWNWEPASNLYTRTNLLIDQDSVTIHGKADPLKLKFAGLHGSRHSASILAQRFDALRDRYTGPPLHIQVRALPSLNALEVGDVVRLRLANTRDFVANGSLDRSFEIQNISMDWITGALDLKLFASSQEPTAIAASADPVVLPDSWYTSQGTDLASVLTITGSNPAHVTGGGTLTGAANMNAAGSVFYFGGGDLVIDAGVNINIVNNVQLRIKGFLQNNGTINGAGQGLPAHSASVGFLGVTQAGGGFVLTQGSFPLNFKLHVTNYPSAIHSAPNATVPSFNIAWNGSSLSGIPSDLRGAPGQPGATSFSTGPIAGGNGGASGAGLTIVSRGFAQGVAASINLSGANGSLGSTGGSVVFVPVLWGGSGAGGSPGGLLILLDGASVTATGLTDTGFVANQGATPVPPNSAAYFGDVTSPPTAIYSAYTGIGGGSLSGARGGSRVQYIPASEAPESDVSETILSAPTNFGLASGTAELLIQQDGTVVARVKATWTPSVDTRVLAYEIQFKRSTDVNWSTAPTVFGLGNSVQWIVGVADGMLFDFRIRSAGSVRQVSDWVTIEEYFVIGKSEKPSNVGALSFTDPHLSWPAVTDNDLDGYIVRYHPGSNTDWASATPAHVAGFITENRFDTGDIVGGVTTMLVKAIDTSGNESNEVSSLEVDLRPVTPTSFSISRQPDGTREFTWATGTPPADLDGLNIRYFLGTTADWDVMTPLNIGVLKASPFETNQLAAGIYTFAAKNVDRASNESAAPIFITTVTIGDPRIQGVVEDYKEEPFWTETKTDCHVDVATGWLVADGLATWADLPATWTDWTQWNHIPKSPIIYEREINIGIKIKFIPLITVESDGAQVIEEQHSDDGIAWSAWATTGALIDAQYIRIRVTLTGSYPIFKTMRTVLSTSTISEIVEDQDSSLLTGAYDLGVGDVRVPITQVYNLIKKVDVSLQSVGAGWTWELVDKDQIVGPRIRIYNASNALADAVFDATVTGV